MKRHSAQRYLPGLSLLLLVFCVCTEALAQNVQYTNELIDRGMRSTRRVNPTNLGLEFEIPLGHYRGRGGHDVPVTLSYSSKLWNMEFQGYVVGAPPPHQTFEPFTIITAEYGRHTVRGWSTSIDFPEFDTRPLNRIYNPDGSPNVTGNCTNGCYKLDRMMVWMPDGSGHEMRATDQPRLTTQAAPDNFYSVDGSRLRYQSSTGTLFLPDGSRYVGGQYIDRNGNTLTGVSGGIRDTLNRTINSPLPWGHGSGPFSAVDQSFSLPGVGTTNINYTLVWKSLGDVLTDPLEPLRHIADSGCPPGNGSYTPKLFSTDFSGRTCIGNADVLFNPVVLHKIILPNNQTYTFTYTVYGEISKIVLPTGGYEKFTHSFVLPVSSPINFKAVYAQANRGVTLYTVSPTGTGTDEANWTFSSTGTTVTVTAPDSSRIESYLWADGATSWGYSVDGARAGRPYDERVYSASGQMMRRKLTQWAMTGSNASGNPSGPEIANRNARVVKELEFLLDTGGGPAVARTKTYGYDLSFQFDVGIEQTSVNEYAYFDVDPNTALTLGISSVPTFPNGTLLRTTETDYLTGNVTYRSRNMLAFPTATRIKDQNGAVVAQSSNIYDEAEFAPLAYDSVLNWVDPGVGVVRGNVTSTSRWVNFDGTNFVSFPSGVYLVTHTQYDQCGSVRKLYDARDVDKVNPTLIDYSTAFDRAYATTRTSADPDRFGNTNGPLLPLATSTEYDLQTGLITATVDVNGQRSEYSYANDPFNRLKQAVHGVNDAAVKNQTTYNYDDVTRSVTVTSDLNVFNDNLIKTVSIYDGLARLKETQQFENATDFIRTLQEYDDLGRIRRKSNPHRQTESPDWTITVYDALSRAISVTTPDTAVVTTVYNGNQVLVTDQSSRQRLSRADALGRVSEVWEIRTPDGATEPVSFPNHPEVTDGYVTRYSYDLVGELTGVTQQIGTSGSVQTRTFNYDSAGRLISAVNPESGTNNYRYDNNGNPTTRIDSRAPAVTTTTTFDALNRVTSSAYSDGTPSVTFAYDATGVLNSKGRLTSVSSSVSSYSYTEYDTLGRLRKGKQTTDGQDYTMEYTYDMTGNLKTEKYPSGKIVAMEYDTAGRLAGVQNQGGPFYVGAVASDTTNRLQYSPHGAVTKMRFGNTLWEHTDFNTRLQATQIGLGTAATNSTVLQLDFGYGTTNNNGNLQNQTITLPGLTLTQTYTYDALNRLETANETAGASWKQKFLYDRYGNRRIDTNTNNTSADLIGPNPVLSLTNNRIVPQSGEQYLYDGAGNLKTGRNGETYSFDGENRMTAFNGGAPGGANYSYDGGGRRVKKVVGTVTTVFVYDAMGQLLAEYSSAATGGSGTSYFTSDPLGSPRVITDAGGAVKSRHDYHPFGEEVGLKGGRNADPLKYVTDTVRQKFTAKERDGETGFDYFGARYLASMQGRFTSADPLLASGRVTSPQTWNRYAYVSNNPLTYVDPDGLDQNCVGKVCEPPPESEETQDKPKKDQEKEKQKPKDDPNPPEGQLDVVQVNANDTQLLGFDVNLIDKVDHYGDKRVPIDGEFEITYSFVTTNPPDGSDPSKLGQIESITAKNKTQPSGTFGNAQQVERVGDPVVTINPQKERVVVHKTEKFRILRDSHSRNGGVWQINYQIVVSSPTSGQVVRASTLDKESVAANHKIPKPIPVVNRIK
jgi:RHS repeat-associated protein